jgi:hypothetical protein
VTSRKAIASCLRRAMKRPDATVKEMIKASLLLGKLNGYFDAKEPDDAGRPESLEKFDINSIKHLLEENDGKD